MKNLFLAVCFVFFAPTAFGQKAKDTLPPMLLLDEGLQAELADALDNMYNFQFGEAEKEFLQIRQRYPQHPLPYFIMGLSNWWKMMPNTDTEIFDEVFLAYMDTTVTKAEALYKANPKNIEAAFFLSAAYGFKGRLYSDRQSWFKAVSAGRNALKYLRRGKQVSDLSPEFMFGDALFNYYAVWIPENYPMLAPIVATFPKGDKKLGLQQLEEVSRKAFYTRIMANYFLIFVYNGEGKTYMVAPVAKKMYENYPENPYFHRINTISTFFMGNHGEAEKLALRILDNIEKKKFGYEAISGRFATYVLAQIYISKDIEKAKSYFEQTIYFAESIKAYDSGYYHTALEWLYNHYRLKKDLKKAEVYLEKLAKHAEKKNKKRKNAKKDLRKLRKQIRKQDKHIENL